MKQALNVLFAFSLLALIGMAHEHIVKAQSAQAATFQGGAAHSTCLTPATGSYFLCVATDGVWVSNNGAAYFQVTAPAASSGITGITYNGTAVPVSAGVAAITGPTKAVIPNGVLQ